MKTQLILILALSPFVFFGCDGYKAQEEKNLQVVQKVSEEVIEINELEDVIENLEVVTRTEETDNLKTEESFESRHDQENSLLTEEEMKNNEFKKQFTQERPTYEQWRTQSDANYNKWSEESNAAYEKWQTQVNERRTKHLEEVKLAREYFVSCRQEIVEIHNQMRICMEELRYQMELEIQAVRHCLTLSNIYAKSDIKDEKLNTISSCLQDLGVDPAETRENMKQTFQNCRLDAIKDSVNAITESEIVTESESDANSIIDTIDSETLPTESTDEVIK